MFSRSCWIETCFRELLKFVLNKCIHIFVNFNCHIYNSESLFFVQFIKAFNGYYTRHWIVSIFWQNTKQNDETGHPSSGVVYRISQSVQLNAGFRAQKVVFMLDITPNLRAMSTNHHVDFENVEVFGHEAHYHQRLFLEAWMSVKDPSADWEWPHGHPRWPCFRKGLKILSSHAHTARATLRFNFKKVFKSRVTSSVFQLMKA